MKSLLKLSLIAFSACIVVACAAPTEEEGDSTEGAASAGPAVPADPPTADYASTPLLAGKSLRAFTAVDGVASVTANLWVSRDGAFTVQLPAPAVPWNGNFTADTSSLSLKITNHGEDDTAQSPYQGQWSYKIVGETVELSQGASKIVLTPVK